MKRNRPNRAPRGGCYVNGRFYRGGQFIPKAGDILTPEQAAAKISALTLADDAAAIHAKLAEITWHDDVYRQAMAAVLRGSRAVRNHAVLRSRRTRAIGLLASEAEASGDVKASERLWDLYQLSLGGVLALAGC